MKLKSRIQVIAKSVITNTLAALGTILLSAGLLFWILLSAQSLITDIGILRSREFFSSLFAGLVAGIVLILFQQLAQIHKQLTAKGWCNLSFAQQWFCAFISPLAFLVFTALTIILLMSF